MYIVWMTNSWMSRQDCMAVPTCFCYLSTVQWCRKMLCIWGMGGGGGREWDTFLGINDTKATRQGFMQEKGGWGWGNSGWRA